MERPLIKGMVIKQRAGEPDMLFEVDGRKEAVRERCRGIRHCDPVLERNSPRVLAAVTGRKASGGNAQSPYIFISLDVFVAAKQLPRNT